MWIVIWLIFTVILLGFFVWSWATTQEQKKAWKAFAQKYDLLYLPGKMMDPPALRGQVKNRQVVMYPMQVESTEGRKTIQTIVEVSLNDVPPIAAFVSSPQFMDFMVQNGLTLDFTVNDRDWPRGAISRTLPEEYPGWWFDAHKDRVRAIRSLLSLPFDTLFFADGDKSFVAIRTLNPINDLAKINKLMKKLFEICVMLESAPRQAPPAAADDSEEKLPDDTTES